eukprot:352088-Chlamydomonas_euryale.AAC.7
MRERVFRDLRNSCMPVLRSILEHVTPKTCYDNKRILSQPTGNLESDPAYKPIAYGTWPAARDETHALLHSNLPVHAVRPCSNGFAAAIVSGLQRATYCACKR